MRLLLEAQVKMKLLEAQEKVWLQVERAKVKLLAAQEEESDSLCE